MLPNKISRIEVEYEPDGSVGDVTFYFLDFEEPFGAVEFTSHSLTRRVMEAIEGDIKILASGGSE